MNKSFGELITTKRKKANLTVRGFAKLIDISPSYLMNIEKARRGAPSVDILERIAEVCLFSQEEKEELFDLAAKTKVRNSLAVDVTDYVSRADVLRAIRTALRYSATEDDWQAFELMLRKKYDK